MSFSFAIASTWVQIDDNNYIDKDSIHFYINDHGTLEYDKKIFWTKSTEKRDFYKDIEKNTKKQVSYDLAQNIVNYLNRTIAVKSSVLYATDGSSILSTTYRDYELEWHSIIPGSNGELWAELVSKPRILKRIYKYQINDLQKN